MATRTSNYQARKQKIEKEIQRLQKEAQTLESKRREPVLASIIRSMREFDISPEEIAAAFNKRSSGGRRAAKKTATATKRAVPPKYRDNATGATWTGRGKAPRWITDAEAAGTPRDSFLIQA